MMTEVASDLIDKLDQYGAPIFHEIDGVRYWGQQGQAEAVGARLEEMTWTDLEIQQATAEAMRRRAHVEELQEEAKALEVEDRGYEME